METVSPLNAGSDPDLDWAFRYRDAMKALRELEQAKKAVEQAWEEADLRVQALLEEKDWDFE